MISMFKWLHHILDPHCPDCKLEKECKSCDTLRSLLEQERFEKKQLLELIVAKNEPVEVISSAPVEQKPIGTHYTPWRIRQQLLEQEDRAKARILNEQKLNTPAKERRESEQIAEMEKELGIDEFHETLVKDAEKAINAG